MTSIRAFTVVAVLCLAILAPGIVQAQTPPPGGNTPPPFGTTPTPGPPTPTPITPPLPAGFTTLDRLRNITYPSEYSPSKQVALVGGKAEWNEPPLRGNAVFMIAWIGPTFAAAILGSSTGGSGSFTTLHLVTNNAGTPVASSGLFIGDRTRIESIGVEGDRVRLGLLTQGPTDPQCCPTQREIREFVHDGNTFRLVSTVVTQPGHRPEHTTRFRLRHAAQDRQSRHGRSDAGRCRPLRCRDVHPRAHGAKSNTTEVCGAHRNPMLSLAIRGDWPVCGGDCGDNRPRLGREAFRVEAPCDTTSAPSP